MFNEDIKVIGEKYNSVFSSPVGREVLKDLIERFDLTLSPAENTNKLLFGLGAKSVIDHIINLVTNEDKYKI